MELLKRLRSILLYLFISVASLNAQWTVPTDTTGTDLILLKAQFTDSMNNYRTGFYLDTTRIDTSQWGSFVRDHQTINFSTAGAITDSLDKYRTAYKLDTTAIDTAMFGKFVRDHEATAPDEVGDIASVTAGDGLSGGGITGDLTIAVKLSAIGGLEISGDSLRTKLDGTTLAKSSAGLKVDTTKMATQYDVGLKQDVADTSAKDATRYWVTTQAYLTSETGDIAGVTAGNWLSGGGTTGTVTLAVDTTKSASVYDLTLKQDVADTSVKDATRYWVQSQGYGTGGGDIEGVTAGVGISGGGTTGTVTVNVDTTAIAAKVWVPKAVRDSLDFYRTNYKLDTTKVDTSQWGKFVRDHESSPDGGGISAAALTDSLDKYRTSYKLDTTAIDTSQWHEIIRDWSDSGTYSLADNAVTVAKLDTAAAGWIDVRKFGATGDGVTDDASAINAAMAWASENSRARVYVPAGVYLIGSTIHLYRGVELCGEGSYDNLHSTRLFKKAGLDSPLVATDYWFGGDKSSYYRLRNLCLDGNKANQTSEQPLFACWGAYVGSYILDCFFYNGYGPALQIQEGGDMKIDNVWIQDHTVSNYAVTINDTLSSITAAGIVDIGNIYIENITNSLTGDPRDVPADRANAIFANKVYSLSINEIHSEGCLTMLTYAGASGLLRIGRATCSWYGSGNDTTAVIRFKQVPLTCMVGPIRTYQTETDFRYIYNNTADNNIPNAKVNSTYPGFGGFTYTSSAASHPVYVNPIVSGDLERKLYNGANASWGKAWADSGAKSYFYDKAIGGSWIFGAMKNQSTETPFFTMTSYGNAGDYVLFNKPFQVPTLTTAGDRTVGSIYTHSSGTLGLGPVYQRVAGSTNGTDYFATVRRETAAPSDTADHVGQLFLNTTARQLYVASKFGTGSGDYTKIATQGDSLTVGAGGVWMRNMYQSGNDLGIIFYNSALGRIDTVFAKQP